VPDPVTSGAAIAGKAASALVTPKLRDQLFGPMAKAYGDHWGDVTKERLEAKRAEKRKKNARSHMEALPALPLNRTYEDIFTDPQFEEWASGAADVDPELDPELADFWRAALAAIAQGYPARLRLLRLVKTLAPDDAVFLACGRVQKNAFHARARNKPALDRLENAGVVVNIWASVLNKHHVTTFPFVVFMYFFLHAIVDYMYASGYEHEFPASLFSSSIDIFAIGVATGAIPLLMTKLEFHANRARRLTHDGLQLMRLLDVVRTTSASPQKEAQADSASASPQQ